MTELCILYIREEGGVIPTKNGSASHMNMNEYESIEQ